MSDSHMPLLRRQYIEQFLRHDWLMRDGESALTYARELFRELTLVEKELGASISAFRDMTDAAAKHGVENDRLRRALTKLAERGDDPDYDVCTVARNALTEE